MTDKFLKLNKDHVGILKALNDVHSGQNYHPWTIDGQTGIYLSYEFATDSNAPKDFVSFFETLDIVEIPNAKIKLISWSDYNSMEIEHTIRAAYNPYDPTKLLESLYHYTDANGVLGITSSKKLWATHYSFLNDYNEFEYAKKIIRERVNELLEESAQNIVIKERSSLFEDWFKHLNVFIVSFSTEHDRLSQWRGYSNFGKGYCLEFKTKIIGLATPPGERSNSFTIRPVLYDKKEQIRLIDDAINTSIQQVQNLEEAKENHGRFAYEFYRQLHWNCLLPIVTFKCVQFEEEKEWRAIHLQTEFDNLYPENLKIHFRVSAENIIPYIELDLNSEVGDEMSKFPLKSITYGPALSSDMATKSLKMILNKNKVPQVSIKKSNLTLR